MIEFAPFPKIARFSRDVIVTEKLDGTNAQVIIDGPYSTCHKEWGDHDSYTLYNGYAVAAASRTRLIKPGKTTDNYGFAAWVRDNAGELVKLGPGRHFGEWWGAGIQRGYGLNDRRFSLFNVSKWIDPIDPGPIPHGKLVAPDCCRVVPVLYKGGLHLTAGINIEDIMLDLKLRGSEAAPGYMNPEGIVIFHTAAGVSFKKTFEKDEKGKEAA